MKPRFLILTILSFFFISCSNTFFDERLYLLSNWSYSIEGINGEYHNIDNNELSNLARKNPGKSGYVYLKNTFTIPEHLQETPLACYLGTTKMADRAYINGNYIGNSGFFPPHVFPSGEISSSYSLPSVFLNYEGENELLIVLWTETYGSISTRPFITTEIDATYTKLTADFLNSKIFLLLSSCLIVVSFIYLLMMILRPKRKEYLSFGGLTLFSAFYLCTVCYGEYPSSFLGLYDFLLFEKIFAGIISIFSTHFAVSFIRDFLGYKDTKKVFLFRFLICLFAIIIAVIPQNLNDFYLALYVIYVLMFFQLCFAVINILKSIKHHDKKVFILLAGFSPILISIFILAVTKLVHPYHTSLLPIVASWILTIFLFLSILIYNLSKSQNNYEFLNKNLEKLVSDRTEELTKTNIKLEDINSKLKFEKMRAEREIELASFVQQNFFTHEIPEADGWDICFYSKAMAGVSGDLFDFYLTDKELNGFGIFDVSGHGIASGLVTMLVKNIINQEFLSGKDKELKDVVSIINDRVIKEKGNIENYLTGIVVRVSENTMEMVNAGHPLPYFYRISDNSFTTIDITGKNRFGVIGIEGLPAQYESLKWNFESGDEILFYTDGITESLNNDKVPFGRKDFMKSFKRNIIRPFDKQIDGILNDLKDFTNTDIQNDDITLLIFRKH